MKQVDSIQPLIAMDYKVKLNLDYPNPTGQVEQLVIVLIELQATVVQHFDYLKVMIHFHLILVAVGVVVVELLGQEPVELKLVAGPELVDCDLKVDLHRPKKISILDVRPQSMVLWIF